MTTPPKSQDRVAPSNKALINEAIERILLDVVIRGHGDRLIGRWSREPHIQQFIERVPYLLDRINQLHLICTEAPEEASTTNHHHHHYRHHHHHHRREQRRSPVERLHEFVNLIGADHHWLVRTRDSLGLTPLHKAVIFHNAPIAEFIVDRYADELAPNVASRRQQPGPRQPTQRLIDAQDKYGRSALHYAAALANSCAGDKTDECSRRRRELYRFLILKGADRQARDFRGKTADFYARHPQQLRVKSVVHLANKLNANYQAAVLTRTLRALTLAEQRLDRDRLLDGSALAGPAHSLTRNQPAENRESMSVSCADLRDSDSGGEDQAVAASPSRGRASNLARARSHSTATLERTSSPNASAEPIALPLALGAGDGTDSNRISDKAAAQVTDQPTPSSLGGSNSRSLDFSLSDEDGGGPNSERGGINYSDATGAADLKRLRADRCERPILDRQTRARVRKCLREGKLEGVNQLVIEGLGEQALELAPTACWNAQCKRYIANVIPDLLARLDRLHESVVGNKLEALRAQLASEPILARVRRPYKRGALNVLHLAVAWNREKCARFLLARFPELVQQVDSHGATCLHWAARSLHNERLYLWLSEHFGAQLESARDARGKTAADYRQQAIRLASFDCRPHEQLVLTGSSSRAAHNLSSSSAAASPMAPGYACRRERERPGGGARGTTRAATTQRMRQESSTVDAILDRTRAAESSLALVGTRARLEHRRGRTLKYRATTTTMSSMRREPVEQQAVGIQVTRVEQETETASSSSASEPLRPDESRPSAANGDAAEIEAREEGEEGQEDDDRRPSESPTLLDELAHLDAAELTGSGEPEVADTEAQPSAHRGDNLGMASPPPLPSSTVDDAIDQSLARPSSAESSRDRNLRQIIADCIRDDNFKKLEHLILAGCGRRIEQVLKSLAGANDAGEEVSREMRHFLAGRALEFARMCQQVHETLHECYAHSAQIADGENVDGRDPEALIEEPRSQRSPAETWNSTFHKLSNLLAKQSSLIMARDQFGASPVHVALLRSDARLLDFLLRRHPQAASAPDHDNRTALHYAAIVLAALEAHGPLRLTSKSAVAANFRGYWKVDEFARSVYANLCARFGRELGAARDRRGRTAGDYLSHKQAGAHSKIEPGVHTPRDGLGKCCGEFSEMLTRYNYLIWVPARDEDEPPYSARVSRSEPVTRAPSVSSEKSQAPGEESAREATGGRRIAKKDSTASEPTELLASLASSELVAPVHAAASSGADAVRQAAPEPVLGGCRLSSPPIASPVGLGQETRAEVPSAQQQTRAKRVDRPRLGTTTDSRAFDFALVPPASPSRAGAEEQFIPAQPVDASRRRNHHHHHHHNHHRNHHKHSKRNSPARLSVVGGVIVPTIIHNDKMDEIETYDIIYRQPLTSASSRRNSGHSSDSSSCSSLSSSSASSSASSLLQLGQLEHGRDHHHAHHHHHPSGQLESGHVPLRSCDSMSPLGSRPNSRSQSRARSKRHNGAFLSGGRVDAGSELNQTSGFGDEDDDEDDGDDDDDEDEDDDRVERLSNEFEDRVRREKCELRAKVDQMMREIKSSAKSGKSSRFLASPNDLANDRRGPGGSARQVSMALDGGNPEAARPKSLSTTTTSVTSSTGTGKSTAGSQASTCSSSSSLASSLLSSTISSVSSPATSIGGAVRLRAAPSPPPRGEAQVSSPAAGADQNRAQHLADVAGGLVSKNTYGQTYLHFIASKSQSSSTLYKVLNHGNHLIGERDLFYRTARDVALQFNLPTNVQVLDKYIIDLFINGRTQLLWLLLSQGYSPLIHVSDPDGNDIMLILKLLKQERMIACLLQMADFQRWRDELHTFIRHGYSAGVSKLIKKHPDLVRAKSVYARTSLHLAVLFDRADIMAELIAMDPASVNVPDNMGRTPLHYSYGLHLKNGEAIRDKLLASGANLELRDVRMRTPKYYYIFRREIEEIRRIELELN